MNGKVARERAECEQLFAEALRPVASELRMVDLDQLIVCAKSGAHAEMADLVASCAELYFAPGALDFALGADAAASWEGGACVSLDLEFRAAPVTAFLRLTLGRDRGGVEILAVHANGRAPHEELAPLLAAAIERARLAPRGGQPRTSPPSHR
jgi:hypothetical protein